MYSQLPGHAITKTANRIGLLLVIALISATVFVILRYAPARLFSGDGSSTHASVEPAARRDVEMTEDHLQRLDDALENLKEASAATARSEYWSDRALSSLDEPALTAKRLQAVRAASRSAEAQIDRARTEIEIIHGILTDQRSGRQ